MSIKRTIFAIHPMIRNMLLLLPLFAILLLYFLQEGISIDSLKIGNFKMQGLYLKLDNKLTLKIKTLDIPKKKNQESLGDIDRQIRRLKTVLGFFEYIELDSLRFINDEYRVIYADNTIYINNNDYEVAGMIAAQDGGAVATLPVVRIKKYHLSLQGKLYYGYKTKRLSFVGTYALPSIRGAIKIQTQEGKLSFWLNSHETDTISKALDVFTVPSSVRVWIDKNMQAKKYRLRTLQGRGIIEEGELRLDWDKTYGAVVMQDVKIKFNKMLAPVVAKKLTIRFHDKRLDFDLKSPQYLGKSLKGSKAALLHLAKDKPLRLLLRLQFRTAYDEEIVRVLEAYKVKIPLRQTKGKLEAAIDLDIDLRQLKVALEGRVFIEKGAQLVLGGVLLQADGGAVTFTKSQVGLWDIPLSGSSYRAKINGRISLASQKAKLRADISHFVLGKKGNTSLGLYNQKKIAIALDYSKGVRIEIPKYHLVAVSRKKGGLEIIDSDIRPLLPFFKNLPIKISSGAVTVRTKDYKRYSFQGKGVWKQSYLYTQKESVTTIAFSGSYANGGLILHAMNDNFVYDSKRAAIHMKNIHVDMKKMLKIKGSDAQAKQKKLKIIAKNSKIRYGKYLLLTDSFRLSLNGKNTTFIAKKDGDRVRIEKNGKSLFVHADKIKDRMLKALIHFGGLRGGRYSLELLGSIDGELKGVIDIEGGAVESFKAYNDLIALFNTIPALMMLSDPGFSKKGYVVRTGKIEFRILKDKVVFDQIYIDGKSSTISGKGTVDIGSGRLNIDLAVRTAREVGKVLGSLPIVGYILFGKDKSITTGVKITGTMQHPQAKTHPVQEVLLYPLELLRRTITSPAHIINN